MILTRRKLIRFSTAVMAVFLSHPLSGYAQMDKTSDKILIVYYSKTGGTRSFAKIIQQKTGADILDIQPATPYSTDYQTATKEVRLELLTGKRRGIQPINIDLRPYNVIMIGTPRWWGTLSVPIIHFLMENDLSDKTIIPFSTHGGGDRDKVQDDIKVLYPKAKILTPLALTSHRVTSSESEITSWLQDVGVLK